MKSFRLFLLLSLFLSVSTASAVQRSKYNFNSDWLLSVGDHDGAEQVEHDDSRWQRVTLPRAFNEDEAFKVPINRLSDTIMWYRKHFKLNEVKERKFFIEFEGVRFG
ncbi:MAG: beta-galactosidase, partial [Prevotella sp.]|nr:beta-galactosidase [Prevotella sp.]